MFSGLANAKRMRRAPSATERMLWRLLRDRCLEQLKFRRQVPIGRYVADFVCFQHRLIVEADGPLHDEVHDAERDAWLQGQGFRVLRIPNDMVARAPESVLDAIFAAARFR
jgi:very-short-patch-repair endonuclease